MTGLHEEAVSPPAPGPLDLATAFAELQNMLLDGPEVTDFLRGFAALASASVPGARCGVTLMRGGQTTTVASSDDIAPYVDGLRRGPCADAIRESARVEVPDLGKDARWGDYAEGMVSSGVVSIVALPLVVDGRASGALTLFGASPHAFSRADVDRAEALAHQASTALTILLRQARLTVLDEQYREAMVTRALIDQALGILMVTREITSSTAFETLRHISQTSNRKVSVIAAEMIEAVTGQAPQLPRPLGDRDTWTRRSVGQKPDRPVVGG